MNLIPTRWYIMFFMPSGVSVALIALGLFLAWRQLRRQPFETGRCRKALAIAASGLAILYFASTPWVAALLARSLERPLISGLGVAGADAEGEVVVRFSTRLREERLAKPKEIVALLGLDPARTRVVRTATLLKLPGSVVT